MSIDTAASHIARALNKYGPVVEQSATGSVYIYAGGHTIRVSDHRRKRRSRVDFDFRVDLDTIRRPIYGAKYIDTLIHEARERVKKSA